ncbi:MAG: MarR family transcriptional regulator [Candidatus Wallbacteria bacterium]|nr:MarR family transcriptional regulator [Candidatus Wallbacteria bacterium]
MGTHYQGTDPDVRALDAFIVLARAGASVSAYVERGLATAKPTASQLGVLEAVLHLGPMCQSELAAKLLVSPGNVTTVLDNLERRKLIRRERGEDRRRFQIHLTGPGRKLIEKIFPGHVTRIREAMTVLSPEELLSLRRLLRKLGTGAAALGARPKGVTR